MTHASHTQLAPQPAPDMLKAFTGVSSRHIVDAVQHQFGWRLEIVLRSDHIKGFQILPRRWVVERTFGWLGRYRRLSRDFEHTCLSSEAMTYIASVRRMLKLATK